MTSANVLTLSRIALTFLFMFFLFKGDFGYRFLALFTFLVASLTDFYDGRIARRRNEVTDFGRLMDPIADKILILSAFLAFVELDLVPAWMVILIVVREFLITGIRLLAFSKGKVLGAERRGKHKTATQMTAVLWILSVLLIQERGVHSFFEASVFWVMLTTALVTVGSGIRYLVRNRDLWYGTASKQPSG